MKPPRALVVATRNQGKLKELRRMLSELPFELRDLDDFPLIQTVPETGQTFLENASLKAAGYAHQTGLLTLADDSGLEVDALGGAPGVLSARYTGGQSTDSERIAKLLAELAQVPEELRTARFVSVIAIANEDGKVINSATGVCEGRIAPAPKGTAGFGYDPVFIPNGFDRTFGELTPDIKSRISHRGRALADTSDFLRTLTEDQGAG